MHNLYLFQPQYSTEIREETNYWLPYSAGCLWSYVSQFNDIRENFELKDLIFRREPPDQLLNRMKNPKVVGFSCYIWNVQYCLTLAKKIKERWPNCIIVFGGPQSSGKMIRYEFIDSIIMAEGEESFLDLLRTVNDGRPPQQFYQKQRLYNLDIPSPYTTGVFDQIMTKNPNVLWSMTFETNRGCPYSCTFCDWGGVTYSKIRKFDIDRVRADLEWCIGKPIGYAFCADANFGTFKERDIEIAKILKEVSEKSKLEVVNVQYAKHSSEVVFTIAKILGNLSKGVTISVQSMNKGTLEAIKRQNLSVNNVRYLMNLSEKYDVATYTELILGLPLETTETWKQGFSEILEMGQHNNIDIWFAQLLENSELANLETRRKYGIKSVIAKDYVSLYHSNDCRTIDEEIELINQTNTMSTNEMVECYMYGWMIMHFHIGGYSQIYAKFARYKKNIPYRKFYDRFFDVLSKNEVFQEVFLTTKNNVKHYLYNGVILSSNDSKANGHTLYAASYKFIYENKDKAYQLSKQVAESFGVIDENIDKLQTHFVFDNNQEYPAIVNLDLDISTGEPISTVYEVVPRIETSVDFDFYRFRRQGLIKNKIIKNHGC